MDVNTIKGVEPNVGFSAVRDSTSKLDKAAETGKDSASLSAIIRRENEEALTEGQLAPVTEAMNRFMQSLNADLQFAVHEKTKHLMVRLVDTKQNKVLKEFPSHEFLDTIAKISDYVGALLDKKV